VVYVYVGGDECLDAFGAEVDVFVVGAVAGFVALEQAAVYEQAVLGIYMKLVAGAGYAGFGAVVFDVWVWHFLCPLTDKDVFLPLNPLKNTKIKTKNF